MHLTVKFKGREYSIDIDGDATVADLAYQVQAVVGVHPVAQQLIYRGRKLPRIKDADAQLPLAALKVLDRSKVLLIEKGVNPQVHTAKTKIEEIRNHASMTVAEHIRPLSEINVSTLSGDAKNKRIKECLHAQELLTRNLEELDAVEIPVNIEQTDQDSLRESRKFVVTEIQGQLAMIDELKMHIQASSL
eukprot:Clim_evm55s235 gene=Clim_evmTU55s235